MNCQKCRTPLRLDRSLDNLNPAAYDLLIGSTKASLEESHTQSRQPYPADRTKQYEAAASRRGAAISKKTSLNARRGISAVPSSPPAGRSIHNPAMSFVMLTDSQMHPAPTSPLQEQGNGVAMEQHKSAMGSSLSRKIETNARLFEILSSRSDIDHPVCAECMDLILVQFESRLQAASKERDAYISFLKELKNNIPTDSELAKAKSDLAMAKQAEEEAYASLLDLQKEKDSLQRALEDVEAESRELEVDEERFWRSRNDFDMKVASLANTRDALNASYAHDVDQLDKLQRTNIYNDLFCIGHDGHFGTINGLRLGRLPPPNNIEWPEINAAWGATTHLLATVADKLGCTFQGFVLRPMGSTTRIDRLEPTASTMSAASGTSRANSRAQIRAASLELYSSGDLPLGKTILHRKFNEAMVAFLECLKQLGEHVERSSSQSRNGRQPGETRKLPYAIERDKIHGLSIKLGASQDEAWTAACKYTLTCCKFLLAYASNMATTAASSKVVK